ncbi:4-hydroxy-tetrahydrodipicolinate synthase [Wolbachia endosymbiont of Madathamugadia hiepei]|uniref:4-hydroxy-tetrahydrodipicolinate synthase n=1 Tax=Wolbachia endosymbiont of Madathamugadia hiepei TaxID=1241303 RepID=UPI00158AEDF5|nr:4-hydroxy-tetrahydrodipicolinate synthase [Wolbachia endosymbiont of Madathamugadia hiepei]
MKSLSTFLWTACVTPFNCSGDSIDYRSLQRLLTMQAEAGNGVVLLGSTGEGLSLTDSEKRTLVEFVCKLELNTKIMVGVPGVNLHQALKWLDFCKDIPIHGYLMTTPIYTKPGIMGQTLWFEKLLEKAHVPAMLYNIPSRAGVNLHVETVRNLSSHEKFWAIKDSSGTFDTLIEYKKVAPNVEVFCGDDNMISDMVACGATGLVSVASNIWPHVVHEYVKRCLLSFQHMTLESRKKTTAQMTEDNVKNSADVWQQACKALFIASNPIPTKALLHDIGLIEHKTVRLPLSTEDLTSVETLRQVNAWMERIN